MDFWDLTKLMFRRWYVSVPLFLVAVGATLYVASRVEPDYVATSYVQLVPPAITPKATDDTKASARNPWLDLGLASLTKAAMISVQDQKVVKQLEQAGFSDDFTAVQDPQLPIVTFEVIGDDETQSIQTTERLVKHFSDTVLTLQKEYGAPKDQMITARRLDMGDNIEESTSKIKRALIAVAGVGVLLATALTVAADAVLRRRRRNRREPEPDFVVEKVPPASVAAAVTIKRPPAPAPAQAPAPAAPSAPPGKDAAAKAVKVEEKPRPGDETQVIPRQPGEDTVVLPASWQVKNGSKRH
ncbi:hypothetical protein [Actinoplanes sp. NPDC051494]|uniref:hypothetical protein n=1 Tax=Actinoplanes sp. NPDC051494 TaxID=3363907 RepID=UPI0037A49213